MVTEVAMIQARNDQSNRSGACYQSRKRVINVAELHPICEKRILVPNYTLREQKQRFPTYPRKLSPFIVFLTK